MSQFDCSESDLLSKLIWYGALLSILCSCKDSRSPDNSDAGGTLVIATAGDANTLFPPLAATTTAVAATELIFDVLADVGPQLNTIGDAQFRPRLADTWQWFNDSLAIAFHINPKAKWHDGSPVRAGDIRFTF